MAKQNISVLAVDDEEPFLEVLKSLLEQEGFFVNTANDGVAAINILQTVPFDIILLDLKMPRVDGVEVLKFIKDHFFDMQVIMLTGVNDVKLAVECMQLGAYHYITKPYSSNELLAII
ncbi:MAG: response regulator, partial [Ignavibacteriales bacterium]|nr:response regulator [Ignavibacteriales bacterium]